MIGPKASEWYKRTPLVVSVQCSSASHCADCRPTGDCDTCDTIDGRWTQAVAEYASTCDLCGELTMHELMAMDPKTQLGYCASCVPKLPEEIRVRISQSD